MRFLASLAVLALVSAVPVRGLTPHLIKDLNPNAEGASSDPESFAGLPNGLSLFVTAAGLWRSDGTAPGTFLVSSACEDFCLDKPRIAALAGNRAFFWMGAPLDYTLWITDGSPAGTFRLSERLQFGTIPRAVWMASRRLLFFTAGDAAHGLELWRSDGTPAGTYEVADVRPGPAGSEPNYLTGFEGRVYFSANDGTQGPAPALWSSDGTAAGTRLVRPAGTAALRSPFGLAVAGKNLLFLAANSNRSSDLWRVNAKGTAIITPVGTRIISGSAPVVHLGRYWFVADSGRGHELWASDGTAAGTRVLTDFKPAHAVLLPLPGFSLANRFVFLANDGSHGIEPWVSDGTRAGTRLLRDLCPGSCSSHGPLAELAGVSGKKLYLRANDGTRGYEPWVTDGTAAGTRIVRDICPGSCSSGSGLLSPLGPWMVFDAGDTVSGSQLWRTDGTPQGTLRLSNIQSGVVTNAAGSPVRGARLFTALERAFGNELWRTDGTPQGTYLLEDLAPYDLSGSFPRDLQSVGDTLWFTGDGPDHAPGLWRSDGTAAGTLRFVSGESASNPRIVAASSQFFFTIDLGRNRTLWRTDGTAAGTVRLDPPNLYIRDTPMASVGNMAFFVAAFDPNEGELWKSDGTAAGTAQVIDLVPGSSFDSRIYGLTAFGGRLWFTADRPGGSTELWTSDGTEAGTKRAGLPGDVQDVLGLHGGRLWYLAQEGGGDPELWSTDGTEAGTRPLVPGIASFSPGILVPADGRMFLAVFDGPQRGLWISDGTEAGTHRISENVPAANSGYGVTGGRFWFSSFGTNEQTLWQSDGTEAGTHPVPGPEGEEIPVFDLSVGGGRAYILSLGKLWQTDGTRWEEIGLPGLQPQSLPVAAGSKLFFQGVDPEHGAELWGFE